MLLKHASAAEPYRISRVLRDNKIKIFTEEEVRQRVDPLRPLHRPPPPLRAAGVARGACGKETCEKRLIKNLMGNRVGGRWDGGGDEEPTQSLYCNEIKKRIRERKVE